MNRTLLVALAAGLVIAGCSACSSGSSNSGSAAVAGSASSASASSSADAGGGSTPAAAAASGTPDPCTLATAPEIQAIFGGTVAAGSPDTDASQVNPTCTWQVTASKLGGSGEVDIFVPVSLQDATKFGYAKDGTPGAIDVPGIGDTAFYSATTDALSFATGDTVITVQSVFTKGNGNTLDAAATQQKLTALATQVAGAL
ncbi:hypothetical protein [Subtercola lobariae]|uniref:DUF3558 domain-containing protein n=1 Tax=Subtercola lobariae TaxID=1588641 RepID=A0A917BFM1_9MICO|nr:hypothetical protein [Subtercola lobariae]GGF38496.1 hypothetical protein GCM10011399_34250 [Subtercola lobariae]